MITLNGFENSCLCVDRVRTDFSENETITIQPWCNHKSDYTLIKKDTGIATSVLYISLPWCDDNPRDMLSNTQVKLGDYGHYEVHSTQEQYNVQKYSQDVVR